MNEKNVPHKLHLQKYFNVLMHHFYFNYQFQHACSFLPIDCTNKYIKVRCTGKVEDVTAL